MFVKLYNGSVIDTDFKQSYDYENPIGGLAGWYGIFRVYEDRKLDVAKNVVLAFRYWSNHCITNSNELTIAEIITSNKIHNPLYPKYKEDIEKYLMLV